jgi:hypothetical protein
MAGWAVNTELERMWKETLTALLQAVSWHLPEETEKSPPKKNLSQNSLSLGGDLNPGPQKFKALVLTTALWHLV